MMNVEQKRYWQKHISLFAGTFSCFCRTGELRSVQVHGKIHQSNERYADIETERVPIQPSAGERISFHMDLYVEEPHLSRTLVTLPHNQIVTSAMVAVQASRAEGLRHIPIGKCLGWYYPTDTTIVLWECFLDPFYRSHTPLAEDLNMHKLWKTIETYFCWKFPRVDRMLTPFHHPVSTREAYQSFLRSLGYEPVTPAVYGKRVDPFSLFSFKKIVLWSCEGWLTKAMVCIKDEVQQRHFQVPDQVYKLYRKCFR